MAKGIEKLVLQRFRGATTSTVLEFDPKKMVVMLFGENGTGKSTIIDAIDLVCNGSAGSLHRPSVSMKEHLPSLGATVGDVSISLTCDGTTWNATHDGKQVRFDHEEPTPVAHILRRNQLLQLIDAEPAKKYEGIEHFIDVGGVETSENALKSACDETRKRSASTSRLQVEAEDALHDLWHAETDEAARGNDATGWAAAKAGADITALTQEVAALGARLNALENVKAAQEAFSNAQIRENEAATEMGNAQAALVDAATDIGDGALVELLQSARDWLFSQSEAAHCPVCEQVAPAALQNRIEQRLASLQTLQRANNAVNRARNQHEAASSTRLAAQNRLYALWNKLRETASEIVLPEMSDDDEMWASLHAQSVQWQERHDETQRDINQFNAIRQLHERVLKTRIEAAESVALERRLKQAYEVVREQRHAYTKAILDAISTECDRLYALIHPQETVGKFSLFLHEKRRASLNQTASFQGHDGIVPQAYFSESHLDTLGFCLFLALAKHQSGEDAVIVLDDVFTSVDSRHLRRIVELLSQEANSFRQVIIATHYRNWRDQYRYLSGSTNVVELMELHSWSLNGGVRKTNSTYAMDDLRNHLQAEPLNRQALASLAGVLMEAALDHLALLYRCGLPRCAEGNYTLGELSDAVNKVSKHLQVEHAPDNGNKARVVTAATALKPILDDIKSLTFIRNQVGGHFNLSGADICDDDVREFAQKSLTLLEALACPECGVPASKAKDDFFKCNCGHTRLKPLKIA